MILLFTLGFIWLLCAYQGLRQFCAVLLLIGLVLYFLPDLVLAAGGPW